MSNTKSLFFDNSYNSNNQENENIYSNIFLKSPNAGFVFQLLPDNQLCLIELNDSAINMIGKNTQIKGKPIEEVFTHLNNSQIPNQFRQVASKPITWTFDLFPLKTNENTHFYSVRAFNLQKNIMAGIFIDITAQSEQAKLLLKEQIKFKTLFEQSKDAIYIVNIKDRKIVECNGAAVNLSKYSVEELKQMTIEELHPQEERPFLSNKIKELTEDRAISFIADVQHIRKNGSFIPIEIKASKIEYDSQQYFMIVARNILERKRAEEELKDSEARLRILFDYAPDAYYLSDLNGNFIDGNISAEKMIGITKNELIGNNFFQLGIISKKDAKKALGNLKKNSQGKGTGPDEFKLYRKDGTKVSAEIRTYPVKIKDECIVLGIARDITEYNKDKAKLKKNILQYKNTILESIRLIGAIVDSKDRYTSGHQKKVAELSRAIAIEMKLSNDTIEGLYMAGFIHDVGKISIPTEILSKPGKLSQEEFNLVKKHSDIGYSIIKNMHFPWDIGRIVYQHHEKLNGSGYPLGLSGNKIRLEARIICVADVIEAMASHRPYRPALGIEKAIEEIKINSGFLYDQNVVKVCIDLYEKKKFDFERFSIAGSP